MHTATSRDRRPRRTCIALYGIALAFCVCAFAGLASAALEDIKTVYAWNEIKMSGDIPAPRCDHSTLVYNNKMYIFGGYSENDGSFNDMFVLDIHGVSRAIPTTGDVPDARSGHYAGLVGSKLVIAGGIADDTFDDIYYVDLALSEPLTWVKVTPSNPSDGPGPRAWGFAVAINSTSLFVYGGFNKYSQYDSHIISTTNWRWVREAYTCADASGGEIIPELKDRFIPSAVDSASRSIAGPQLQTLTASVDGLTAADQTNATALSLLITDHAALYSSLVNGTETTANGTDVSKMITCGGIYFCPNVTCTLPPPAEGMRIATDASGRYIYLYGGWMCGTTLGKGGPDCFNGDVFKFDLVARTWQRLDTVGDESLSFETSPPAKSYGSFRIIGNEGFEFGGAYKDAVLDNYFFNDLYVLNLTTSVWRTVNVRGQKPPERWSHTLSFYNRTGYLFGGCKSPNLFYNTLHKLFEVTPDPSRSIAFGPALTTNTVVGNTATFRVEIRDNAGVPLTFGGNDVVAFGFEKGGFSYFQSTIKDLSNGTYDASFKFVKAASFLLSVQYNGVDIKNSPFTIKLLADKPDATQSTVAIVTAAPTTGSPVEFDLSLFDQYLNKATTTGTVLSGTARAPSGVGFPITFGAPVASVSRASFEPTEFGAYTLEIYIDGKNATSPAPFTVQLKKSSTVVNLGIAVGVPVGCSLVLGVLIFVFGRRRYQRHRLEKELAQQNWRISGKDVAIAAWGSAGSRMFRSVVSVRSSRATSRASGVGSRSSKNNHETRNTYIKTGEWKGTTVALKTINQKELEITRDVLMEVHVVREARCANLVSFLGAIVEPPSLYIVNEYCSKGSLADILYDTKIQLDSMFKFSLLQDLANGMKYLHTSDINCHGRLKPSNCVVDGRWALKITDYGLWRFRFGGASLTASPYDDETGFDGADVFYQAPEHCAIGRPALNNISQKGDIYSFGIIASEVVTRLPAYSEHMGSPQEIVTSIIEADARPDLTEVETGIPPAFLALLRSTWHKLPAQRPTFDFISTEVKRLNPQKGGNVVDNIMRMLESYATNLEALVAERTVELDGEKRRAEELLYRMIPKQVADELKVGKKVPAETFEQVTIFFSDIVGFTVIAGDSTPMEIVELLNDLYVTFDSIVDEHDVYKVETIGDAYMCVSGLPNRNGLLHAGEIATMALSLLSSTTTFRIRHMPDKYLQLRIGIHTGPAVAGVVGLKMPRYCLFGDTVNTASRMESGGFALRIHMSDSTARVLATLGGYNVEERGEIQVKGKGSMRTYWLTGKAGFTKPLPSIELAASMSQHHFK
eukprot:Opistho-2@77987